MPTAAATIADAPLPPVTMVPPVGPAAPVIAPTDARAEAVAGQPTGTGAAYRLWAGTLPVTSDDLERDFPGIYDQMARDPQIAADTMILCTSVLNTPVQVQPGAPEGHPAYAQAAKMAAFAQENLDRLPRPLDQILYELMDGAIRYGHKAAEVVWTTATWDAATGPQTVLARLTPKPRTAYLRVRDGYGRELGFIPRQPGQALPTGGLLQVDPQTGAARIGDQPVLPLAKLPTLSHHPTDGDMRGESAYRVLYNAWYMTQQTYPELLAYEARFGQPSLKLTNAPGLPDTAQYAADGVTPITSKNPNAALLAEGEKFRNGGVIALSAGQLAELIEAQGEGAVFFASLDLFNRLKTKGLLGQTLATNEGSHRSGADASTHQSMLAQVVRYWKSVVAAYLRMQVLLPLMVQNFGPDGAIYCPVVSLGQTDPFDFSAQVQALAQLAGQGFWDNAKVPPRVGAKLDARLGLPVRDMAALGPDGVAAPPDPVPAPAAPPPTQEPPPHA